MSSSYKYKPSWRLFREKRSRYNRKLRVIRAVVSLLDTFSFQGIALLERNSLNSLLTRREAMILRTR